MNTNINQIQWYISMKLYDDGPFYSKYAYYSLDNYTYFEILFLEMMGVMKFIYYI